VAHRSGSGARNMRLDRLVIRFEKHEVSTSVASGHRAGNSVLWSRPANRVPRGLSTHLYAGGARERIRLNVHESIATQVSRRTSSREETSEVLRSDDTDAPYGVASGCLAVGSALMLPYLFAANRLLPSARERVHGGYRL
jgi:hypothetical protein